MFAQALRLFAIPRDVSTSIASGRSDRRLFSQRFDYIRFKIFTSRINQNVTRILKFTRTADDTPATSIQIHIGATLVCARYTIGRTTGNYQTVFYIRHLPSRLSMVNILGILSKLCFDSL